MIPFYYESQLKSWLTQVGAIFASLVCTNGVDDNAQTVYQNIPIKYGYRDRVADSIGNSFTQNKLVSLPVFSLYMTGIEYAVERESGKGVVDRRVMLKQGGVFPDDLRVVERQKPTPYNMQVEISLFTSNTQNLHEILEQILLLFNPILVLQNTDAPFDGAKLTYVRLDSVNNQENYQFGPDRRMNVYSFSFTVPVWLGGPMELRDTIIKNVNLQIGITNDTSPVTWDEWDSGTGITDRFIPCPGCLPDGYADVMIRG